MADRFAESNNISIQSLKGQKQKHATKYKEPDKCLNESGFCRRSVLTPFGKIKKNCQLFVWSFCTYIINNK